MLGGWLVLSFLGDLLERGGGWVVGVLWGWKVEDGRGGHEMLDYVDLVEENAIVSRDASGRDKGVIHGSAMDSLFSV